jgi:hypothetical protein
MSVIVKDGVGFGTGSSAAFYTDVKSKKFAPLPDVVNLAQAQWAAWGDDNEEPLRMCEDIENNGVLSAGILSKVRMAIGNGIFPAMLTGIDSEGNEQLEWVQDLEINRWLELNKSFMYSYTNIYNLLAYGWGSTQIILNNDRDYINRIKATDVVTARLEKKDLKTAQIQNLYLCADYTAMGSYNPDKMQKIPVLQEGYEMDNLQNLKSGHEFAILHRLLTNGKQYYPRPLWKAAQAWVNISRSIPAMKEALHKNQMSIKYVVLISDSFWERTYQGFRDKSDDDRKKIINDKYNEIDTWLTGEKANGKSIITGSWYDPVAKMLMPDIQINVIDEKWKDGKMLPDNAAADKQILFSMFFNPAIWGGNLLGDGASGGAGSGSDIREAFIVQLMLMQAERVMNLDVLTLVKYYNGWADRLESEGKFLVFRYKTGILTTLDTGGSTQTTNS